MSVSLQSCHKGALTPTCFNLTWAQNSCIETHEFCIHCLEMSLIAVTSSELRQVANLWSRSCASTTWTLEKGTKRLWGENCCYCLILAFSRAPGMESLVFIVYSTVQYSTHYITLHYTTLHYITLHTVHALHTWHTYVHTYMYSIIELLF